MEVDSVKKNIKLEQFKITKRLELIKTLILLEEDEEAITSQILKLQALNLPKDANKILLHLQNKAYGKALLSIKTFINKNQQLTLFIDSEIEALRFEAKALEAQIQDLSDEKAEFEKLIHEFNLKHNQELGELILNILKYRKDKLKGTGHEEETKKDYEEFHSNYEATKNELIIDLTTCEQKELKEKYRKASKLCHPDVVSKEQKNTAHKIFMELNNAYELNDLKKVSEILEELKQNKTFTSKADTVNEKTILIKELERLRKRLDVLKEKIITIKTSETFKKILSIKDWDEYFAFTKKELENQINQLKNERK